MAISNRGGKSGRSNKSSGAGLRRSVMATAKQRPLTSAAVIAGAAGAGAFLWAKRAQLTDQISELTHALSERWSSGDAQGAELDPGALKVEPMTDAGTSSAVATSGRGRSRKNATQLQEPALTY